MLAYAMKVHRSTLQRRLDEAVSFISLEKKLL